MTQTRGTEELQDYCESQQSHYSAVPLRKCDAAECHSSASVTWIPLHGDRVTAAGMTGVAEQQQYQLNFYLQDAAIFQNFWSLLRLTYFQNNMFCHSCVLIPRGRVQLKYYYI